MVEEGKLSSPTDQEEQMETSLGEREIHLCCLAATCTLAEARGRNCFRPFGEVYRAGVDCEMLKETDSH